jgi:hypothetical protein
VNCERRVSSPECHFCTLVDTCSATICYGRGSDLRGAETLDLFA